MSTIEFKTESEPNHNEEPATFDPNTQMLTDFEDMKSIAAEVLGMMLDKNRERVAEHFGDWPAPPEVRRWPRRRPSGQQPVQRVGGWIVEDTLGKVRKGQWRNSINETIADAIRRVTQHQPNGTWRLESVTPVFREHTEKVLQGALNKEGAEEFDPMARAMTASRRLRKLDLDVVFVDMNHDRWIERPDGREMTDTTPDAVGQTAAVAQAAAQATLAALVQAVQAKSPEPAKAPEPEPVKAESAPTPNPVIPGRFQPRNRK